MIATRTIRPIRISTMAICGVPSESRSLQAGSYRRRSPMFCSGPGGGVRGGLEPIGERCQPGHASGPPAERERDQMVGEPRVLREQRPVEVGPDQVLARHPLSPVLAVVPEPVKDAA